jgi:hypothetical protein
MGSVHQVGLNLEILAQKLHRECVIGMNPTDLCSRDHYCVGLFLREKLKYSFAIEKI